MTKVFIDGKEGTTGLLMSERLKNRQGIEVLQIPENLRKDSLARAEYLNNCDIAVLCLPDDAAVEAVGLVKNLAVKIIDASTAHRTNAGWAYGFPELGKEFREKIVNSNRVAVPGCHASGFLSIVYPLISCGILPKDYPIVCHSVTGYTGGGKKMIAEYEAQDKDGEYDAPRQYALMQVHKHQREMKEISGLLRTPLFNPIVADFPRGMAVSLPLYSDLAGGCSAKDVYDALCEHYAGQKMVKVMAQNQIENGFLAANRMAGRNDMEIYIFGGEERILAVSVFDNLGKGASGAAVQCMNIMTGLREDEGL